MNKPITAPVWMGTLTAAMNNKHIDWTEDRDIDYSKFYYSEISDLASEILAWAISKKFLTPTSFSEDEAILAKLMLIVSELGEAAEAVRNQDSVNFAEELADIAIRLLHLSAGLNIPIHEVIAQKMIVNEQRPDRHGKQSGV